MRGGWHHTGDLGRFDEDGYLIFVDRKKDALRRRGENVSSVQLESAITSHPKIAEAAVIAVPSEMTEDDIKACIVLEGGVSISPEELFGFFAETLPYFAMPRYVEVVDALPKTATMRVQKHVLREAGITPATWDFEALGLRLAREDRR
jgi:crotonobetaine/carnitine-CoA ligase